MGNRVAVFQVYLLGKAINLFESSPPHQCILYAGVHVHNPSKCEHAGFLTNQQWAAKKKLVGTPKEFSLKGTGTDWG